MALMGCNASRTRSLSSSSFDIEFSFRFNDMMHFATGVTGIDSAPMMGKGTIIFCSMVETLSGIVIDREQQMQHGTIMSSRGGNIPC